MNAHPEWSDQIPGVPVPRAVDYVVKAAAPPHGFTTFRVVRGATSEAEALQIARRHIGALLGPTTVEHRAPAEREVWEGRGFPPEYVLEAESSKGDISR